VTDPLVGGSLRLKAGKWRPIGGVRMSNGSWKRTLNPPGQKMGGIWGLHWSREQDEVKRFPSYPGGPLLTAKDTTETAPQEENYPLYFGVVQGLSSLRNPMGQLFSWRPGGGSKGEGGQKAPELISSGEDIVGGGVRGKVSSLCRVASRYVIIEQPSGGRGGWRPFPPGPPKT